MKRRPASAAASRKIAGAGTAKRSLSLFERTASAKTPAEKEKIEGLHKKLETFGDPAPSRPGQPLHFDALTKVEQLFDHLQEVDAGPTPQVESAAIALQRGYFDPAAKRCAVVFLPTPIE